jgi:hypothetical protein
MQNHPSEPIRGLGDIVERVAQPVAVAIDRVAGTKIRGCQACQRRRDALNRKFPLKEKTFDNPAKP